MKHGFIGCSGNPYHQVADCKYNGDRIIEYIDKAKERKLVYLYF